MSALLDNFYEATDLNQPVQIKVDGAAPDISGDTVQLLLKVNKTDTDADAALNHDCDVATSGVSGIFYVDLSNTETKITPRKYFSEFIWTTAGGDVTGLDSDTSDVLDRI